MGATVDSQNEAWALEVVRGRDAGRVFALGPGEVVLGNAPADPTGGIDLADQEGSSPRRMAPRHAAIDCSPRALAVRDLESPGGTFVNRRRVLPGRAEPLRLGDVIQLGAIQLKVVAHRGTAPAPPPEPRPASAPASFVYTPGEGATCRSWDDFLAVSSQRWELIRGELTSGRLAAFLVSIGRPDLAPPADAPGSADDRLDAWLGRLPTTRPARPELDVHPARLLVRVTPGGGTVRRVVRVANVGHRLLRSTARVEPPGLAWLTIAPEFARGPFATAEGTDLAVEIAVPETLAGPMTAELVIEGNGGTKRVAVVLEPKPAAASDPAGLTPAPVDIAAADSRLLALIARQSTAARVATWGLVALAARLLVGAASGSIGEDAMTPSGPDAPKLGGVALALAAVGALLGGRLAWRRGGAREAPPGGFAGGFVGVIAAAAAVAACRSIEPALGPWSSSLVAVCGLWTAIGVGLAAISTLISRPDRIGPRSPNRDAKPWLPTVLTNWGSGRIRIKLPRVTIRMLVLVVAIAALMSRAYTFWCLSSEYAKIASNHKERLWRDSLNMAQVKYARSTFDYPSRPGLDATIAILRTKCDYENYMTNKYRRLSLYPWLSAGQDPPAPKMIQDVPPPPPPSNHPSLPWRLSVDDPYPF